MASQQRNDAGSVLIIGAGPAGLTTGYTLAKHNIPPIVLEADPVYVGGISRTVNYKGFHFDIGGHRFFSKAKEVEDLWTEILPNDFLERPRSSRIFYNGKFYSYPLKGVEALTKLGPIECSLCIVSYAKSRMFPIQNPRSFEDWVSNQFGARLFQIFFKTYTEKVWGMSCKEISADWAAQRIKGLSLSSAIKNALFASKPKNKEKVIKTLIDSFRYPRKGPGMMWEACTAAIRNMGGTVHMGQKVTGCVRNSRTGRWLVESTASDGAKYQYDAAHVVSSAPIRELVQSIQPIPGKKALDAANRLSYRDFLTVVLILKDQRLFPDNWIYIHDPKVKVGRIQNYKSWSPEMVPDAQYCCYGLEYFCFEGDGLWSMNDRQLIDLAKRELEQIGIGKASEVLDGCVVRQHKAYPVYDDDYAKNVQIVREVLEQDFPNLHLVGRNGMHKYNNQDHAMMTGLLTAKNIIAGQCLYNVWQVNQDAEYHESGTAGAEAVAETGVRLVPSRAK